MTGRCGFYEAADFTVDRMDGQDYAVIRLYGSPFGNEYDLHIKFAYG